MSDLIDETHEPELLVVSEPPLFNAFLLTFPTLSFDPLAAGLAFLDGLFTHNLWWSGGDHGRAHEGQTTSRPRRDRVRSVTNRAPGLD